MPSPAADRGAAFSALQDRPGALLLPNAWDVGSARLLASAGFEALATTSGGFAASMGRRDYAVGRSESLAHAAAIAAAVDVPVTADLEDGFADDPAGVAATVRAAKDAGLAGCSIEDARGAAGRVYDLPEAVRRVEAAVAAAREGGQRFVVTARAENALWGNHDLGDTVRRLQAYEKAGADAVYAPGLSDLDDIKRVVESVTVPVNVLLVPGGPTVRHLETAGVRRVSLGSSLAFVAYGAALEAAELLRRGDEPTWWGTARTARSQARHAFGHEQSTDDP